MPSHTPPSLPDDTPSPAAAPHSVAAFKAAVKAAVVEFFDSADITEVGEGGGGMTIPRVLRGGGTPRADRRGCRSSWALDLDTALNHYVLPALCTCTAQVGARLTELDEPGMAHLAVKVGGRAIRLLTALTAGVCVCGGGEPEVSGFKGRAAGCVPAMTHAPTPMTMPTHAPTGGGGGGAGPQGP